MKNQWSGADNSWRGKFKTLLYRLCPRLDVKFNVVGGSTWNASWVVQIGFTRIVWLRTRKQPVGDGPEWWLAAPKFDGKKMRHVRRKWGRRPVTPAPPPVQEELPRSMGSTESRPTFSGCRRHHGRGKYDRRGQR